MTLSTPQGLTLSTSQRPKIRDYAMHADWAKITAQDVGSVLGFVEQLLVTKFS